ncbi:cell division protein [Pelistega indica]|uniref:Cell division protein n=1 Tax=Pelistega indica TaxID=1414851 RepID=V8G8P6_9BURK|nr:MULTISPECIES: penicillin-binding protein 2 [Pelistega]ETD72338.1 cell division protein [Pelistega indica]
MKKWFNNSNWKKQKNNTNISRNYETAGEKASFKTRGNWLYVALLCGFGAVAAQALYHQAFNSDFLRKEGDARYEARIPLHAERGRIVDRNGEFLATSVPASSIWVVPEQLLKAPVESRVALAKELGMDIKHLDSQLEVNKKKAFLFLKRQIALDISDRIKALKIKGVNIDSESKRLYPQGSLMSHIVGFTNIENDGIEGLEKQYNKVLEGADGSRVVIRNRLGAVIEDVTSSDSLPAQHGDNIQLTIDSRVQFIAKNALEKAIKEHDAESGGVVVIDATTGDILSMVSMPTYDPNNNKDRKGAALRNRVITDTFEPGSIIKPLVAALALDAGVVTKNTKFATGNGVWLYQGARITDVSTRNGTLDVAGILRRSSNIGMAMMSERLRAQQMWTVFNALGFGQTPTMGFPGAAAGRVRPWKTWLPIEKATMSYGYGLSVSLIQVAQAYTALARDGDMISLSLVKRNPNERPTSIQVFSPKIAKDVRMMLEGASGAEGSKIQAKVNGYRLGGKSGTARQLVNGQYSRTAYRGSFVALAPVSNPRIVVAVTLDKPKKGGYYGTVISGPVVAEVVEQTLKYLGVPPDAPVDSMNTTSLEANNKPAKTQTKRTQG